MKIMLVLFCFFAASFCYVSANQGLNCKLLTANQTDVPKEWAEMVDSCTNKILGQINMEIHAALSYLAMGTHFAKDRVNRPGFSEFFFKSASEERQHAIKLIEYLLMRGQLTKNIASVPVLNLDSIKPTNTHWNSGVDALKNALQLETSVTKSIKDMMVECEEPKSNPQNIDITNDYHFVDYLTTEYLEEQYKGQRDLAGKISTLGKMKYQHGELAEFLFDKKMLSGEV